MSSSPSGPVLVTGAAGFIGFHVSRALLARGEQVVGADDLNPYYDPALKQARVRALGEDFALHRVDLADPEACGALFEALRPSRVVHLAAQAGVRASLTQPRSYVQRNLVAFSNVLEGCRDQQVQHLLFASSSSVYGDTQGALVEQRAASHPVSLYAATKRANELQAHAYAHLFGLPTTGMRYFSVYGPWGRPDMALWLFTEAILAGRPIRLFNGGQMSRDLTYIEDAVAATLALLDQQPEPDPLAQDDDPSRSRSAPYRVVNVGGGGSVGLEELVSALERALGRTAIRHYEGQPQGEVLRTRADPERMLALGVPAPRVGLEEGVQRFVAWYLRHHALE